MLKRVFAVIGLGLLCSLSWAQATSLEPLIEVPALRSFIEDSQLSQEIQLLDIRSPEAYAAGHLPQAINAPYGKWRGPATNPGQLAEVAEFESLITSLGLKTSQPLVIYSTGEDTTDFGAAARVYWTLKYLGFDNLSLLNGGFMHWKQALAPVVAANSQAASNSSPESAATLKFAAQVRPELAILQDEILQRLEEPSSKFLLLDSRPPAFYLGQQKAPMATTGGTLAGAENSPFGQWFRPQDTRLKSAAEIKRLVEEQNLNRAEETVSFCNTGHWAATNWFVLSEIAQVPQVRLYPASMAEWTQAPQALPMDNAPSRWQQIKTKFAHLFN